MSADAPPHRSQRHVLVVGGGVAALEAILALDDLAAERVSVAILSPERRLVYKPLAVAEPFGLSHPIDFDVAGIIAGIGGELFEDAAMSVDPAARKVETLSGERLDYDMLLIASGSRSREWLPGAIHFGGPDSIAEMRDALERIERGEARRLVFALGPGPSWILPLYELALLAVAWAEEKGLRSTLEVSVVTPESEPLHVFGTHASEEVRRLLERSGVDLLTDTHTTGFREESVELVPRGSIAADVAVTLPRAEGPGLPGLPSDSAGFLPIDDSGRVIGAEEVWAAGDATDFPVKQGGIACQEADVAARSIAAAAGADVVPIRFEPVLRGVLLTGEGAEYLRAPLTGGHGDVSEATEARLWAPAGKIIGQYLGPRLADYAAEELEPPTYGGE